MALLGRGERSGERGRWGRDGGEMGDRVYFKTANAIADKLTQDYVNRRMTTITLIITQYDFLYVTYWRNLHQYWRRITENL